MDNAQRLSRIESHRAATASFQLITPDKAKRYLAHLGPERTIVRSVVDKYATAMVQGTWREYHPDPIILNTQGALLNAQHRLSAIVRSGKSYYMLVVHYHDDAYTLGLEMTLDRGKMRSTRDVLTIGTLEAVTRDEAAVTRHLYYGIQPSTRVIPDHTFVRFYQCHKRAIADAIRLLSPRTKRISLAPVMAAVARALATEPAESLARFAHVLRTGESLHERELSIVLVRNWLLAREGGLNAQAAAEVYARTTRGLRAYVDGHPLKSLVPATEELFPMPEGV